MPCFSSLCVCQVLGEGIQNTEGIVQSVSEQLDQVTVELNKEDGDFPSARYAHSVKIPLARVQPVRNEVSGASIKCCCHS